MVVSFGVLDGAKRWREETECPYKLYIDPDRTLYQYVGLSRSIYKVRIVNQNLNHERCLSDENSHKS